MASSSSQPSYISPSFFPSSSNCTFNHPHFLDTSQSITNINVNSIVHGPIAAPASDQAQDGSIEGLHLLHATINPNISLYSSARYPPPQCHKGIVHPEIKRLVANALNASPHSEGLVWVHGPMGAGKSANAQSFSQFLGQEGNLASAVFLSSTTEESPWLSGVLPTIAYQIAVEESEFFQALGSRIRHNPALLSEALPQQFFNLLVAPLQDLAAQGRGITRKIIIVDGIDSCGDARAQRELIDLIAASVRQKSTPFLWVCFTRQAPHLQAAFDASCCISLELTVSRELDPVISTFLSDNLDEIARQNGLAAPWPPGGVVDILVDKCGGFPLYASSLLHFIRDGPQDPNEGLQMILDNVQISLPGIDSRYTTLMRSIPPETLKKTQMVLLAISIMPRVKRKSNAITQFLNMPEREFNNICKALLPVLGVSEGGDDGPEVSFYHPAFMEFMQDASRSQALGLWASAESLREMLFERLIQVQNILSQALQPSTTTPDSITRSVMQLDNFAPDDAYENIVSGLFRLCQQPVPFREEDNRLLAMLRDYPFAKMCLLGEPVRIFADMEDFLQNIPLTYRSKIIRSFGDRSWLSLLIDRINIPAGTNIEHSYILGHGHGRAYCWGGINADHFLLVPCPKHRIIHYLRHSLLGRRGA